MFSEQDAGSPRSSVVYGSIISYIEGFFNALGMSFGERQVMKYFFYAFEDMVAAPVLHFIECFLKASDVTKLLMVLVNLSALFAVFPVMF